MAGTITASVIKNDTTSPPQFQNSAGTQIGTLCRAWVNFNGSTAAIRAAFNVSSITKNGGGDYTLNFTNAMPDADFSCTVTAGLKSITWGIPIFVGLSGAGNTNSHSTTQVRFATQTPGDAANDTAMVNAVVFR